MNRIVQEDIKSFVSMFTFAGDLQDATVLVTGGTGLIGSLLIRSLLGLNKGVIIVAPVRNLTKARAMFEDITTKNLFFEECDLLTTDFSFAHQIDYIVHCAAPTASRFFVEHPIETYDAIYLPSIHLLEYARTNSVKSMVYLSSLEVYGTIADGQLLVSEDVQGYLNPLDVRSSYPMAKRAVEHMCHVYAKLYGVPVKIARLTQTTGAGCAYDDNRVIVQFTRLGVEGKDIILHTTGEAARPYCYTMDAISGILCILLKGQLGEAYNVANEQTYISAKDLALFVQQHINPNIAVRIEVQKNTPYAPCTKLHLDASKLRSLGWTPQYGLEEICTRLADYLNGEMFS